jgi:type I restriction enzyme R subunit
MQLAQFKPALAMNPDLQTRYAANRLRVVRQVRYSQHNENSIDLVLFLNGIPVATVELKTDFTQSIDDAVDQYRFDRQPKPKGQSRNRCWNSQWRTGAFRRQQQRSPHDHQGCRDRTTFLPFNRATMARQATRPTPTATAPPTCGNRSGRGTAGWKSLAATWWPKRDSKKKMTGIIFPRYHQLDATRKLLDGRCWRKGRAANT